MEMWKMARNIISQGDDMDEKADRWRRLGELEMEAGLREAGFSGESVAVILSQARSAGERIYQQFWEGPIADSLSEIEDGRSALLAIIGRGVSPVKELWLTQRSVGFLSRDEATALCVNLSSNPNVRVLALDEQTAFGTQEGCAVLANALKTNSVLENLSLSKVNMGSEAARCLMDGLQGPTALEDLSIGYNPLSDEGVGFVAEMLSTNSSLRHLYMHETLCGFEGAADMASALERNSALEVLFFGGNPIEQDGMKRLLEPFSRYAGEDGIILSSDPQNTALEELELSNITRDNFSVESMAWMIKTNNTLSSLSLASTTLLTDDWVDQIFPALRENETLKELDLRSCEGLTIEGTYDALIELIKSSKTGLETIELAGTDLEPRAEEVEEELNSHNGFEGRLRGQAQMKPMSRRFGLESAGSTMSRRPSGRTVQGTSPSHTENMGWDKLTRPLRWFLCVRIWECNETCYCECWCCRSRCCCCCCPSRVDN